MKKDKNKLSFKFSMFWFLWGLTCWVIGQFISNRPKDIFLIVAMSIATFISAPLSYLIVNKNFKEISITRFCGLVIPMYIILMILIGIILYLLGFITV